MVVVERQGEEGFWERVWERGGGGLSFKVCFGFGLFGVQIEDSKC